MKKTFLIALVVIVMLPVLGCAKPQPLVLGVAQSDKPRITQPAVTQSDQKALADGNNAFALRLYNQLRQLRGSSFNNLFFSPFSIAEALAMTYAGASSDTAKSMASALNFAVQQDCLHPAFNYVDLQLKSRGQGAKGATTEGFKLNVVSAIWGQQGITFLPAFLDILAQDYGAGLRTVDFINKTEDSRIAINRWVSDQSAGKINDLLPSGSVNTMTRLVLTNAVYFNAAWQYQFDKSATADGTFRRIIGGEVTVPMMHESVDIGYTEGSNYRAIELPYDGQQLSMVILLPSLGQFGAFEVSMDGPTVQNIISNLKETRVSLTMPKFQFSADFGLKLQLTNLGMASAFTSDADFSGMDGKKDLRIQDVEHKAYISVDENGTEATAATSVVVGVTAMPADQATVILDMPFVFFIRDIPTGVIIFAGRVMDPTVH